MGADLRWERLNVVQPPSPTGSFTFSNLFTDLPGTANTGTPLASFLLGQVQQFSIDLQQDQIRNRAHFQEYFVQDDWRVSDRVTVNAGVRYTLNFPSTEENNQAAVFNLETQQLEYLGRDGQPRAARQLHKLNFGPRLGIVGRVTDKTVVRDRLRRWCGSRWPASRRRSRRRSFPFLQTVSQRTLDNIMPAFVAGQRSAGRADSADAGRRPRPGRVRRRSRPGLGLRAAVERVGAARAHARTSRWRSPTSARRSRASAFPTRNLNQLTRRAARAGRRAAAARAESVLRHHPALVVARRSDDSGGAAAEAVSAVHDGQPLSQQRRHDDLPRASTPSWSSGSRAACRISSATRARSSWTTRRRCSTRRF